MGNPMCGCASCGSDTAAFWPSNGRGYGWGLEWHSARGWGWSYWFEEGDELI